MQPPDSRTVSLEKYQLLEQKLALAEAQNVQQNQFWEQKFDLLEAQNAQQNQFWEQKFDLLEAQNARQNQLSGKTNAALEQQNGLLEQKLHLLEHELAQLKRLIFGTKSERFLPAAQPEQLDLFAGEGPATVATEAEAAIQKITYERRAAKAIKIAPHGRSPIPDGIPRREIRLEPAENTADMTHIGDEITEELEYKPGRFFVRKFVRPKYARPDGDLSGGPTVVIAPLHRRPIEKGIPGPELLTVLLVGKFVDHIPLYRVAKMFERQGVKIADSTLGDWVQAAADLLAPLYQALKKQVLAVDYLQMDETSIKVLESEKKGKSHRGYLWVCHAPRQKMALFEYDSGRSALLPDKLLDSFQGTLQSDGYAVYDHFGKKPGIVLAGCLAHSRREFERALDNDEPRATWILAKIQLLYAVEREAREQHLSPDERLARRQQFSRSVFDELRQYLETEQYKTLPKSAIGGAIAYFLNRREKLERFLLDGHLEIDNNLVENAIRPVALGRKNYLFAGNHAAAQRIATMYSLMACCKLNQINPHYWLCDVLFRLPDHPINRIHELLPGQWKLLDKYPEWWTEDSFPVACQSQT